MKITLRYTSSLDRIELGKLSTKDLRKLLNCVGKHPRIHIPPTPGYDSGVHLMNKDEYWVVSTDPCIGVPETRFGWLLIHYAASDVALFGAKPDFCTITLLGPTKTQARVFIEIMKQACSAAKELEMGVITGHTGTYDGVTTMVGVCTAYGTVLRDELITSGGSQAGDCIICTKQLGLETAVNFSLLRRTLAESVFTVARTRELQDLITLQTCVKDALLLARIGGVHAMHDATEGGLIASLNEMADSSRLGFSVNSIMLPIMKEARILQKHFSLSQKELLSMSSTGTLLAAVDPRNEDRALKELRKHGIEASTIGIFTKNKRRIILHGEKATTFPKIAKDPYNRVMWKKNRFY